MDRRAQSRKQRIHIFSPATTDELNRRFGQNIFVGAASQKIVGLGRAIKVGGALPVIVTGQFGASATSPCVEFIRSKGLCFAKLRTFGGGGLKRLSAAYGFLAYSIHNIRRRDIVLMYNFFPEYIPAALYLRLFGIDVVLDIEDGPRSDQPSLLAHILRYSYRILRSLASARFLTVSKQLGDGLQLDRYLAIPAIVLAPLSTASLMPRFSNEYVHILYGGAISIENGSDLFVETVRKLIQRSGVPKLHFHVTGMFSETGFGESLRNLPTNRNVKVSLHTGLSAAQYKSLAADMDIGLSLRRSHLIFGQTSFPSKVLELASLGLLVCTTVVSDMEEIFDEGAALLLRVEDADALVDLLLRAADDREGSAARAAKGCRDVLERYSDRALGPALVRFLVD